jgi:outer membrane immunogenic protein
MAGIRWLAVAIVVWVGAFGSWADGVSSRGKIAAPEQPRAWIPPALAPAEAANWNGFYAGIHGPYHFDSYEGYGIGGQVGVNFHNKSGLLLGVELDYTKAYLDRETLELPYDLLTSRLDQYGSLRARVGYTMGNLLFYGTGGYAMGFAKFAVDDDLVDTRRVEGWVYGGGAELKLSAMTVKAEYLHYEFGNKGPAVGIAEQDLNQEVVRVGVNFPFSAPGSW